LQLAAVAATAIGITTMIWDAGHLDAAYDPIQTQTVTGEQLEN
jgi:hypothetical protein